jgi:thioesterase-3
VERTTTIKIRGYHTDAYGHVNNARYLEFLEEGRWAAFEETRILPALTERALEFTPVNISIDFRRAALVGDTVETATRFVGFGERSGRIQQTMRLADGGTVVAEATITFVMVDRETGRAAALDDHMRALFEEELGAR